MCQSGGLINAREALKTADLLAADVSAFVELKASLVVVGFASPSTSAIIQIDGFGAQTA
jgi:hypothetical protein